jgi:methionyl-tRNA formyltransferase
MSHENAMENKKEFSKGVTLFLMTEKGYEFLKLALKKYKSLIEIVVVGSDESLQKDFEKEIIQLCESEQINFIKRKDLSEIKSQYAMAVSWRWMIDHPADQLIIFHDSPLPKYRGFAPLVNALINGEKEIGVSAIFGASDYDEGDLIYQSISKISYPLKIDEAIRINNINYLKCAEKVFTSLLNSEPLQASKQIESDASYSVWRDEDDYCIDWNKSSSEIRRFVDALGFPYKGALTSYQGKRLRILDVEEFEDVVVENRHCGKVLFVKHDKPVVICGKGMLKINHVILEEGNELKPFLPLQKFRVKFDGI